jgi:hypothetical protein
VAQIRQSRALSGCVAGAPLRSPPHKRKDTASLQHAVPGRSRKRQEIFVSTRHHRRAQVGSKEHRQDELRREMQFHAVKAGQEG